MLFRSINILLLAGISWQYGHAQDKVIEDTKFDNYTPLHGLPSDFIETITQDKYGFIWLGTHNGLLRFDGMEFNTFLHNNSDSNTLPDNDARSIAADSTGKIWIASRKGLFYYDYSGNNFIRIRTLARGLPINWATSPVLDRNGQLWFYSNEGICRIDCKTMLAVPVSTPGSNRFIYSTHRLFSTAAGHIWFFSDSDFFVFDSTSTSFRKQPLLNNDGMIFREGIQGIFEESGDLLWIASFHGFYLFDRKLHRIQRYPFEMDGKVDSSMSVQGMDYCRPLTGDSILWCSTLYQGVVLFDLHTRRCIRSFRQDNYDASSLGGSLCYTSFVDRNGIVWVSHINGLSKLDWHDQQIKSYRIGEMVDSNRMMPVRKMIRVKDAPGNYWVITWNYGVLYYNKSANKVIRHYREPAPGTRGSIQFNHDALYDEKGNLWVGSETGLALYDPRLDQFTISKPPPPLRTGDTVLFRILTDERGNLWIGTDGGLWKYNIQEKKYSRIHPQRQADSSLVGSPVYALHFDRQGRLFVGTRAGLYILDTLTGKITQMIRGIGNNKTDFNINYIWGLDIDKHDNLWVATRGGGVYQLNPSEMTYIDYKTGNGLITEELRDIFIDSLENVWISSFDGIFRLNRRTGKFSRFTPQDGLDNFNISLGRWSIIDHKIYSGSPGAYSIIDPYARMALTSHFPVWITGIKVLDRAVHFNPDSSGDMTVPVNYTENIINFEFSAIDYTASSKIQYSYMLEGFDKAWHFCDNQRFANYNNLSGGAYTFKVRAMNAEGKWSERTAVVNIYVRPAFWATWWFRALVVIMLALIIRFAVKRRIAAIRKEAAFSEQQALMRQKLAETEMIALRTQMNPHFIFNCMNIIDGLITDNRKEQAQDFLQKFSKLIRLVLENSQYQVVPLHQDIGALRLYVELEAIRYSHYFRYEFDIDAGLLEDNYMIPPLLIQPYVENAIVHGLRHRESPGGILSIKIRHKSDYVMILIEDNGIGRSKAIALNQENKKPHQPIGMNATGKRIDLLRMINLYKVGIDIADLDIEAPTGTRVTITLPLDFRFG